MSRPGCVIREIRDLRGEVEQDPIQADPLLLPERQVGAGKALQEDCRVPEVLPDLVSSLVIWKGRLRRSILIASSCCRRS
jgi:hypothetical protein